MVAWRIGCLAEETGAWVVLLRVVRSRVVRVVMLAIEEAVLKHEKSVEYITV